MSSGIVAIGEAQFYWKNWGSSWWFEKVNRPMVMSQTCRIIEAKAKADFNVFLKGSEYDSSDAFTSMHNTLSATRIILVFMHASPKFIQHSGAVVFKPHLILHPSQLCKDMTLPFLLSTSMPQ